MLAKKIEEALNKQIAMEAYASFLYLSISSWANTKGMEGCATFFMDQSEEERVHMLKIFNYINDMDAHALVPSVDQAPHEFDNIDAVFKTAYEHEKKVTAAINNLVQLSVEEKDYSTENFLQWYVEEQREEEVLFRTILDKIKLIGDGPSKLYYIDKEIEAINKAKPTMQ